jgi:hypothetical protein
MEKSCVLGFTRHIGEVVKLGADTRKHGSAVGQVNVGQGPELRANYEPPRFKIMRILVHGCGSETSAVSRWPLTRASRAFFNNADDSSEA